MPRAEFATYRAEAPAAKPTTEQPSPAASAQPAKSANAQPERTLRILLIDADRDSAARIRTTLSDVFGDHSANDWVSDRRQAVELVQGRQHDLTLCVVEAGAAEATSLIRASVESGSSAPIIVLAQKPDADSGFEVVDAGAADYIPVAELTPATLERSIRHALIREHRTAAARSEIAGLTAEKTRVNTLRDANHRFVENACHDFRSPLTVIKEFASIIAEGLSGEVNEEQAEFLEIILTRVDQLSQMVDAILDASRLESDLIGVKREEHSVAALVEKVRPTLEQRAAAHKVAIAFAIPDSLPNVFADAESIGRVIVNLGANAAKYAGEGSKIEVWARYDPKTREVTIGVTDNGRGIAPENVKMIFDRFQQIPSDRPQEKDGFGLGLHIASELVRVNFGTLTVESQPEKGSTFAFTLPIFDVNSLIPLHFDFLKSSRHTFQNVAITMATVSGESDAGALAEVERLLNRQLRSYDLLLRLRPGGWLVSVACDGDEMAQIAERVLTAYAETNRNRHDGVLPEVRFRPVGTWALAASRPESLRDAIRGVATLTPEAPGIH